SDHRHARCWIPRAPYATYAVARTHVHTRSSHHGHRRTSTALLTASMAAVIIARTDRGGFASPGHAQVDALSRVRAYERAYLRAYARTGVRACVRVYGRTCVRTYGRTGVRAYGRTGVRTYVRERV